ncbi:DUF3618 domain-containing protein [Streptomyces sp. bgisy100]|uniref:DUF3618 domain-containing protein n=1 Tax=Streptomyces sp. bgisy100 TaxID=3413783 RepID=UPI003D741784
MTNTPEQLRGQVAEARERLGATVEELAARADVKALAQHKVAEMKEHMQHTAAYAADVVHDTPEQLRTAAHAAAETGRRRPVPVAAAALGMVLVAALAVRGRHGHAPAANRYVRGREFAAGYWHALARRH